ncbi:protein DpdF [Ectobacillus funiculus]|uniref:protein DpdF n=1 Tax=Ectobacillus funiculus TaxID=137993 RepID=UPI00101C3633|nr:protein DpdF [Ectobacillus funiculus]
MDKVYDLTQKVLLEEIDVVDGIETLNDLLKEVNIRFRSKSSCVKRLFRCVKGIKAYPIQSSILDLAGHLRQFILMFQSKVRVSENLREQLMSISEEAGLYVRLNGEVDIHSDFPVKIPHLLKMQEIYQLPERRMVTPPIGDGILYNMAKFPNYRSAAQKIMVKSCMDMEEGETLLSCLPTGGGKSLVFLLPSFFETEGGSLLGSIRETVGTTIVVVPTVSLAIDQKMSARKLFKNALEEKYQPQAYYGDLASEEKKIIFEGLQDGSLPILFTSPESIVNGALAKALINAAHKGNITRFVIDEAHIVLDWGSNFRTDFQLLTVFQKKLIKATKGKLKTILLSATLSDAATSLLKQLFCHNDRYTEIRGDELRLEPTYFIDESESVDERFNKITKMLPFMPRPIIIYVSKKEDTKMWREKLVEKGYQSVAVFNGDTVDSERERIIREWNNDELDIIVATSAFGMGVDKGDIRTVIHCCLPESVNRFYQEVGRGGRDGFASISLLSYVYDKDVAVQDNLTSKAVLTTEMVWKRWEAMYVRRESTAVADEFWLHMNSQHDGLTGPSGKSNGAWNEAVCLMLARHGVIEIVDTLLESGEITRKLLVKIVNFSVVNDEERLKTTLEPDREKERERVNKDQRQMRKLVRKSNVECFSEFFVDMYPYAVVACGGCPACFETRNDISYYPPKLRIPDSHHDVPVKADFTGSLETQSAGFQELILKTNQNEWNQVSLLELVEQLILSNISTIVLPEGQRINLIDLVKESPSGFGSANYTFLTSKELTNYPIEFLKVPIAIFYQEDEQLNDQLYQWSRRFLEIHPFGKIVHVTIPDIYILSEGKTLDSLIDYMTIELTDFLERQGDMFTLEMF